MEKIVVSIVFGLIAAVCFVFSILGFLGKGPLINNSSIYATKEQREKLNKKPLYRQSAIVFLIIGIANVVNVLQMVLEMYQLLFLVIVIYIIAIIYAIVSSIKHG